MAKIRQRITQWQMGFTSNKYEVLHFAGTNKDKTYIVNGRALGSEWGWERREGERDRKRKRAGEREREQASSDTC